MENEKFIKLTKKQKLEMNIADDFEMKNIVKALFIPLRIKNDGYTLSAFFVQDNNGLWYRFHNYDCFRFINLAKERMYLKGDFENGGVQFFLGDKKWTAGYGGEFMVE